jgi:sigma-B regulation protein RsbU (phosphoserine phosphatase)
MPFALLDSPPVIPGFEYFPALLLYRGETVDGDAIFPERNRLDGRFLFLLIDVAGHGQPAADIVAEVGLFLQDPVCENQQPAALLQILNGMLQQTFAATSRFVAGLAILFDSRGHLIASNAGQPEPWVGQPGVGWQAWPVPGATFLGVAQPDEVYPEGARALGADQQLLAFTDGVTEAGQARGQQFQGQLHAFLDALPAGLPVGQVVVRLLQALQIHAGAAWPEDDTTVVGVHRRGPFF